jgi:hypothetical protein
MSVYTESSTLKASLQLGHFTVFSFITYFYN